MPENQPALARGDEENNNSGNGKDEVTVHISSKSIDDSNTRAEYSIFWGVDDVRNRTGVVLGESALQKAVLTATLRVLEAPPTRLRIATDSKYLLMVRLFRERWKALGWKTVNGSELLNRKSIQLVDALLSKWAHNVRIEFVDNSRARK